MEKYFENYNYAMLAFKKYSIGIEYAPEESEKEISSKIRECFEINK